jgi:hypothetical protein
MSKIGRYYNDQKKKKKKANNDQQSTEEQRFSNTNLTKYGGELEWSGRISSPRCTSDRHVTDVL